MDEFEATLSTLTNVNIICICETWLHTAIDDNLLALHDFCLYRRDRPCGQGGGVCVYAKQSLKPETIYTQSSDIFEYDFVLICLHTCQFILCNLYIPPNLNVNVISNMWTHVGDCIDSALLRFPNYKVVLCGDMNRYDTRNICTQFSLVNTVKVPTRNEVTLDFVFMDTCLANSFTEPIVLAPIGTSDHCCIFIQPSRHNVSSCDTRTIALYDYRESNIANFCNKLNQCDFSHIYQTSDMDMKVDYFYKYLHECLNSTIPVVFIDMHRNDKPWLTAKTKFLINCRWKAYREKNWPLFKFYSIKVKKEIVIAKRSWASNASTDTKNLWRVVHSVTNSKSATYSSLIDALCNNDKPEDIIDLANNINEAFCSVFSDKSDFLCVNKYNDWCPFISEEYIFKVLNTLNCNKSTGSDGISPRLYKAAAHILCRPIQHIVNFSIEYCQVPLVWKLADIVPIPLVVER